MATPGDWPGSNALLSGLFGSLQQGAQGRLDTAGVWALLRRNAATWEFQASGESQPPSEDELQTRGAQILREQGVGIQEVNTYRAVAGQWLAAKQRLQGADGSQQVLAEQIFRPPWAQTTGGESDSRYRIRVNWQITPAAGDVFNKWSTYEVSTPITSIEDVLAHANAKMVQDKYLVLLSGGSPPDVSDFELEQI